MTKKDTQHLSFVLCVCLQIHTPAHTYLHTLKHMGVGGGPKHQQNQNGEQIQEDSYSGFSEMSPIVSGI